MRNRFRPNVTPRNSRNSGPVGTSSSTSTSSTSAPPVCEPEKPQREDEPAVFIPPNSSRVLPSTESTENTESIESTEVVLSSVEISSTLQEQNNSKLNATATETTARKRRTRLKPSVTPTARRTRRKQGSDTEVATPQEPNESSSATAGEKVTATISTTTASKSKNATTVDNSKEQQTKPKPQSNTQPETPSETLKQTGSTVSASEGSQSSTGSLLARRKRAVPNIGAAARRRPSVSVPKESTSDKGIAQPESSVNQQVEEASGKTIPENNEPEERSIKRPRTTSEPPLDNTIGVAEVIVESVATEAQRPIEDEIIEQDEAEETANKRFEEKKRKPRHTRPKEPLDPSKMTLQDLIYFNPKDNPMKSSLAAKRRRTEDKRKPSQSTESENGDTNANEAGGPDGTDQANPTDQATEGRDSEAPQGGDEDRVHAPQVKIGADGCIILDEESLVIKSPPNSTLEKSDIVYEDSSHMNYAAFFKQSKRTKWSTPETLKFYKALSQVGTDFSLMLPLFPKRKRRELKAKFKREEKVHQDLVDRALVHRTPITIEMFKRPDQDKPEEDVLDDTGNDDRNNSTAK